MDRILSFYLAETGSKSTEGKPMNEFSEFIIEMIADIMEAVIDGLIFKRKKRRQGEQLAEERI